MDLGYTSSSTIDNFMDKQPFETEKDDQESNRLYALQPMHHLTSELVINTHKPFNEERLNVAECLFFVISWRESRPKKHKIQSHIAPPPHGLG